MRIGSSTIDGEMGARCDGELYARDPSAAAGLDGAGVKAGVSGAGLPGIGFSGVRATRGRSVVLSGSV